MDLGVGWNITKSGYVEPDPSQVVDVQQRGPMTSQQKTLIYCTRPWLVMDCPRPSFLLRYPNSTAQDIVLNGLPEQSLIDWCRQFCQADKVFVDIGAHAGMYALSLAPYCHEVQAFECQRETYYQLCGGVALNAYWNVHPHHVALGAQSAPAVPLYVVSPDGGGTTLHATTEAFETQHVEKRTLDSYQLKDVGFLKLDVEGSEEEVLRGAVNTLRESGYPPFIFESWLQEEHKVQRESLHRFIQESLGYRLVPITGYPYMLLATRA